MPSTQYLSNKTNLVGRPTNTYRRYHSGNISKFRENNFPKPFMIPETHNERGCAYHGPRAHHTTVDCRRRIRLLIEERRRTEEDRRTRQFYIQNERENRRIEELLVQIFSPAIRNILSSYRIVRYYGHRRLMMRSTGRSPQRWFIVS